MNFFGFLIIVLILVFFVTNINYQSPNIYNIYIFFSILVIFTDDDLINFIFVQFIV